MYPWIGAAFMQSGLVHPLGAISVREAVPVVATAVGLLAQFPPKSANGTFPGVHPVYTYHASPGHIALHH